MARSDQFLSPAEAARRLGVSAKALRLYEARGLVSPDRTAAGYRAYGPDDLARAAEVAALRALGFSLAQVQRALSGDPSGLEAALGAHAVRLGDEVKRLGGVLAKVRALRDELAGGQAPTATALAHLAEPSAEPLTAFDLPWPWGGERFELRGRRRLTYITGPLGSGKTRLALQLAERLPGAVYLDLARLEDDGAAARMRLAAEPALRDRVEAILAWLLDDGATQSGALLALLVALLGADAPTLVIDLIEHGLDEATQEAVAAYLRHHHPASRQLFVLTRSSAILDLDALTSDEAILFCPANCGVPVLVEPYPGAPGYESVASCLAAPAVTARIGRMVAVQPAEAR